jgi:predicted Zn finger-like uncharacterized protein
MLIVCPSCATSYEVKPANLPPQGRQVRCSRCLTVWRAEASQAEKLLAAAAAIGPETYAADEAVSSSAALDDGGPGAWSQLPRERSTEGGSYRSPSTEFTGPDSQSAPVDAPPLAPTDLNEESSSIAIDANDGPKEQPAPQDIESAAARFQPQPEEKPASSRWPLSLLQTGILALILIDTIIIGWRTDIVRLLPQTASFYAFLRLPVNLRGLTFDGIATTTEQHEGVPILVVEGNIVNNANKMVDIPRLKFIVRNAARQEIYSWTAIPSRASLPSGEAVGFRTRLASPPPDARDVIVRFLTRRDVVAGSR